MSTKNRKIWAAGVLLILTVAAAIGFLFRLSQPDQEQRSVYLNCTESDRGGWVFFTEAGPVEPVFGFGGYINGIPAEGTGPVMPGNLGKAKEPSGLADQKVPIPAV